MTKLHTTDEISSPFFPQDFADYLVESGYRICDLDNNLKSYTFHIPFEKAIMIFGDTIRFYIWCEEEPGQRYAKFSFVHEFKGISSINPLRFAMLLDVMGAISLRENFRKTNIPNPSPLESFSSKIKMNLS